MVLESVFNWFGVGPWPELRSDCRTKKPWGIQKSPQGIEKRAAAHQKQAAKLTTGLAGRFVAATINNCCYETVEFGVIAVEWRQICGNRIGSGCMPYVRYLTTGGDAHTFSSIRAAEAAQVPFKYYIESCSEPEQLSELLEIVRDLEAFLIGWIDGEEDRQVWSKGAVASRTISDAVAMLRRSDPFGDRLHQVPERF